MLFDRSITDVWSLVFYMNSRYASFKFNGLRMFISYTEVFLFNSFLFNKSKPHMLAQLLRINEQILHHR